jgi:plastocyanin
VRNQAFALILAVPVLAFAGCGDDNDGGDKTAGGAAPAGAGTSTPTAQKTTPAATTPAAGRSAVAVSATEFKFTPANIDVKSGAATFALRNDGGAPHALEVDGNGIEKSSQVIEGGQSTQLKVTLKPGRYEIYCPVGNHRQMGMEGTLTVT